ncbi:MAG: hypothetical protein ABIH71_04840 [Candidatus Omnitrophota bacterium]
MAIIIIEGKKVDDKQFDDLGYITKDKPQKKKPDNNMNKAAEDELEKEVLNQALPKKHSDFNSAFGEARKRGDKEFEYQGKKYNTNLK